MKKSIVYFIFPMLLFTGCTDSFLDVENHNELDESSFFAKEYDLELAVNAAYCPLMHNGFYGIHWFLNFGTLDDRIWHESVTSKDRLIMNSSDGAAESTFADCYRGIYRCSDVIRNIDKMIEKGIITEQKTKKYEAQLRTLRAMYYFNLVTLFHNPYFYNETNEPANPLGYYGNCDPEWFWDQIDYDLEWATQDDNDLPNRPGDWSSTDRGRMTKGAAWALWGKARLWKHYYYYLENGVDTYTRINNTGREIPAAGTPFGGAEISREENLAWAKSCFEKVMGMGYSLQGENDAVNKQDFLNALLSNTTYVKTLSGFGGKSYKGINNEESVWEVQFSGTNRNILDWLPGWMSTGGLNYLYFGACGDDGGYRNFEMDPEAYYVYEIPEAGTKAALAGFDRDPRAYASMYFDVSPEHTSDFLDYRSGTKYYRNYVSGKDTKCKVTAAENPLYNGAMPFGTTAIGRKKYNYPQFAADSELKEIPGSKPPMCDPYNARVIRFADVLLMHAETCLLLGETATGLPSLNRVRARAGMQPAGALDEATVIKERDYELMGESFRYLDIVRWARSLTWYNAINFSTNNTPGNNFKENFEKYTTPDPKIPYRNMYLPIPLSEINKNGGQLKQNPGW